MITKSCHFNYGYVIILATFAMYMIANGCYNTYGLLYKALLENYPHRQYLLSFIFGLIYAFGSLMSPAEAFVVDHLEGRSGILAGLLLFIGFSTSFLVQNIAWLALTMGVIVSTGVQLTFLSPMKTLTQYFKGNLGFASGISVCGSGIGLVVFAPLFQFVIDQFHWRGAMLLFGAIYSHVCVFGALLISKKDKKTVSKEIEAFIDPNEQRKLDSETLSSRCQSYFQQFLHSHIILYYLSFILNTFSITILFNFVPITAKEYGHSDKKIAVYPMVYGCSLLLGSLAFGFLGDRYSSILLHGICHLCSATVTILLSFSFNHLILSFICYGLFGFSFGCSYSLRGKQIIELFGISNNIFNMALSVLQIMVFIGAIGAPYLGELLRDYFLSYDSVFISSAVANVLAGFLKIMSFRFSKSASKSQPPQITVNIEDAF